MSFVLCPECKKEINEEMDKCPHCGAMIKTEEKASPVICSACKKEIDGALNKCPHCGAMIKAEEKASPVICSACKKEIDGGLDKCPHCGALVKKNNNASCGGLIVFLIMWFIFSKFSLFSFFSNPTKKEKEIKQEKMAVKIGETFRFGDFSYTILDKKWYSDGVKKPDYNYLVVKVSIKNETKEKSLIPPILIIDNDGNYLERIRFGLKDELSWADSVNPSLSIERVVVFDIPKDRKYKLVLRDKFYSEFAGGAKAANQAIVDFGL